jgi:hypothetical protein
MYSEQDRAQQQRELALAYERQEQRLLTERAGLERRLAEEHRGLAAERRKAAVLGLGPTSPGVTAREQQIAEVKQQLQSTRQELGRLPERQRLGNECIQSATVTHGPEGEITIQAKVGPSQPRLNYQVANRSGLPSREGFQRLHSQGPGTGFECDCGILYGSSEVNQELQRQGIEQFIREVHQQKRGDTELWLKTVTKAHPGTSDLAEIQYELSARKIGSQHSPHPVYSATVTVDRNGKVGISSECRTPSADRDYLRELPDRRCAERQQLGHSAGRQAPQQEVLSAKSTVISTKQTPLASGGQQSVCDGSRNQTVPHQKAHSIRPTH